MTAVRYAPRITDIEITQTIRSPIADVFRAMTTARIIDEWGGGPARVHAKAHGKYSLWDGEMHGTIREIEFPTRLVFTWREAAWPDSTPDSLVSCFLRESERGTEVSIVHSGLPQRRIRDLHEDGWLEYYLGPMKVHLENP